MKKLLFYIFTTAFFALSASAVFAEDQTAVSNYVEPQVTTAVAPDDGSNSDDAGTEDENSGEEETSDETTSDEDTSVSGDSDETAVSADDKALLLQKKIPAQKEALEAKKEQIQNQVETKQAQLEQKKVEAKEMLEEKKAVMEQRKAEFKERLTEKRKDLVNAYTERMGKRLIAALDRLTILADRLEDRIEKLSETLGEKLDPTEALANIEEARTMIELLRVDVEETVAEVDMAFDDEDPQTSFSNAKTALREIVDGIKDVHRLLVDAISSLRAQPSLVEAEDNTDEDEDTDGEESEDEDEDETDEEV
ncbi:MAG: hypothetical protein KAR24_01980 [Candidatus Pacebacteria bacterium]|nr:hypothetical protein [Candidatus Paceibacterota bacterium]